MKITSNKTSKKTDKAEKSETIKMDTKPEKTKPTPASFNVDPIENGFVVSKSWTDDEGRWQSKKTYFKENPIDIQLEDNSK